MLAILALQRRKQEGQKFKVIFSSIASLDSNETLTHAPPPSWNFCLGHLGNIITVCTMYTKAFICRWQRWTQLKWKADSWYIHQAPVCGIRLGISVPLLLPILLIESMSKSKHWELGSHWNGSLSVCNQAGPRRFVLVILEKGHSISF